MNHNPKEIFPPKPLTKTFTSVVPIANGGTGVTNVDSVAASLGALSLNDLNSNVIIRLDENTLIRKEDFDLSNIPIRVNINGKSQLAVNETAFYKITDLDSFSDYTIVASAGIIEIRNNGFNFTAPSFPGIVTISINGTKINITVNIVSAYIEAPVILDINPAPDVANTIYTDSVLITSSIFNAIDTDDEHLISHWQVATDKAFSNLILDEKDQYNLTQLQLDKLLDGNEYFVRVRYKGKKLNYSAWNDDVLGTGFISFNIKYETTPFIEEIAVINDLTDSYISSISINNNIIAIGTKTANDNNIGSVRLYKIENYNVTYVDTIPNPNPIANNKFGHKVILNEDATYLLVCNNAILGSDSAIYLYKRNVDSDPVASNWSLITTIRETDADIDNICLDINLAYIDTFSADYGDDYNSIRIVALASYRPSSLGATNFDSYAILQYTQTPYTTDWVRSALIPYEIYTLNDSSNPILSISNKSLAVNGILSTKRFQKHYDNIIALGGINTHSDNQNVYVYKNGTLYTTIVCPDVKATGNTFGANVLLNDKGDRIAVSCSNNTGSAHDEGVIYIFLLDDNAVNKYALVSTIVYTKPSDIDNSEFKFISDNDICADSQLNTIISSNIKEYSNKGAFYVNSRVKTQEENKSLLVYINEVIHQNIYKQLDHLTTDNNVVVPLNLGKQLCITEDSRYILAGGTDSSLTKDVVYLFKCNVLR